MIRVSSRDAQRDLDLIPLICETIRRRRHIGFEDVQKLDRLCHRAENLTPGEADAIFALARKRVPACAEWDEFFAQTLGGWFLDDLTPSGIVSRDKARWLMARLDGDAALSNAQYRLLQHVLENTLGCDEDLLAFAPPVAPPDWISHCTSARI